MTASRGGAGAQADSESAGADGPSGSGTGAPGSTGQPQDAGGGESRWSGSAGPPGSTGPWAAGLAGSRLPGYESWPAMLAVTAVTLAAAGVVLLAWPKATLVIVAILIGIALIVTGLMRLFDGFTARSESGGRRVADILIGVLAIIVGLFCVRHHELSVALIVFIVGAFWVLHGLADLAIAATAGPLPGRGLRTLGGVISLAAGLLVLFWPDITVLLLVRIMGIWLIAYALALGALAVFLHRQRGQRTDRQAQTS